MMIGNGGRSSDISADKNWSKGNFGPCHTDQDWITGSSVPGRKGGGFKISSGSASNGSFGVTSPSRRGQVESDLFEEIV